MLPEINTVPSLPLRGKLIEQERDINIKEMYSIGLASKDL